MSGEQKAEASAEDKEQKARERRAAYATKRYHEVQALLKEGFNIIQANAIITTRNKAARKERIAVEKAQVKSQKEAEKEARKIETLKFKLQAENQFYGTGVRFGELTEEEQLIYTAERKRANRRRRELALLQLTNDGQDFESAKERAKREEKQRRLLELYSRTLNCSVDNLLGDTAFKKKRTFYQYERYILNSLHYFEPEKAKEIKDTLLVKRREVQSQVDAWWAEESRPKRAERQRIAAEKKIAKAEADVEAKEERRLLREKTKEENAIKRKKDNLKAALKRRENKKKKAWYVTAERRGQIKEERREERDRRAERQRIAAEKRQAEREAEKEAKENQLRSWQKKAARTSTRENCLHNFKRHFRLFGYRSLPLSIDYFYFDADEELNTSFDEETNLFLLGGPIKESLETLFSLEKAGLINFQVNLFNLNVFIQPLKLKIYRESGYKCALEAYEQSKKGESFSSRKRSGGGKWNVCL